MKTRMIVLTVVAGILLVSARVLAQATPVAHPTDLFVIVEKPGWTNTTQYSWTGSWGDYDKDGFIDLFVANTSVDGSPSWNWPNFVYRNNRDGTFTPKFAAEVGPIASDQDITIAGYWGDFNNDGQLDLLAVNSLSGLGGPAITHRLYLNQGGGKFASVNAGDLSKPAYTWGWGAVADYDNDGCLDVFLCEAWVDNGRRTNRLFQGRGDGTFRVVTDNAVVTNRLTASVSNDAVWADYDNDGDADLIVANAGSRNFFFRNEGQGQFTRLTNSILEKPGYVAHHHAWGDYDNDGFLDVASGGAEPVRLFRNSGGGDFTAATNWTVAAGRLPLWADYDNDGHLDLLAVGGQASPTQCRLLHSNGDGTFDRVEDAVTRKADNWIGAAWGDYDNDGSMDLVLTTTAGKNVLYHNQGNMNHWIKFVLEGRASNGAALGAKVRVKATIGGKTVWQMREVSGGNCCQNDLRPNFGLGDATVAEVVRIEWPSGHVQEYVNQPVDRIRKITEVVRIQPVRPSVSLGASVTLTNGYGSGTYQWRFNGADLAGETKRTLSLTNLQVSQQGRYSVVVTGSTGTIMTNFAYLTVDPTFTKVTAGPVVTDTGTCWISTSGDYDRDGYDDLLVIRYRTGLSAIYRNNRDGAFTSITNVFPARPDDWLGGTWADLDNDGWLDVFAGRGHGELSGRAAKTAVFYFNNRDGTFTSSEFVPVWFWNMAVADYDRNGWLDLYASDDPQRRQLFRGLGDRTFQQMPPISLASLDLGANWVDYDDDGWLELHVGENSADGRNPHTSLYHNDGNGHFTPLTNLLTQTKITSLVSSWGDYDNDGRVDVCVAAWSLGVRYESALFRNLGQGNFERATPNTALDSRANFTAWADYDNDGFLDLLFTGVSTPPVSLYRNNGDGTFTRILSGSVVNETGPADSGPATGLWFDYDNDGFLDLYVSNGSDTGAPKVVNFLYHNNGNANAWLQVRLIGTVSNRDAVGAKVRVQARYAGKVRWQRRDLSGGDTVNGNHCYAHFGLGDATKASIVRIEWPSGIVQELKDVPVRQILTVTEPPRLESLGQGRLRLLCWARQNYEIEASDDLDSWTSLGVVAHDLNRPEVIDPGAAGHPYRFYRAVQR